jgi:hypothetical protein
MTPGSLANPGLGVYKFGKSADNNNVDAYRDFVYYKYYTSRRASSAGARPLPLLSGHELP